ncbi:DNA polymerase III [Neisseria montereyensis]|uniref:DNA polymerase III n=1 Tax=Neisseria montereyensis TaxID=2973938 RepID=A0ABT2FDQ1_9NEIS|nr:DNA polymerase III [Neisseria montereyensis]MCS4534263.1 DNA polymerase III [Neisseria montereyensis]
MNNEFRLNQLANGLEFLGYAVMQCENIKGITAEQLGNLLLVLSDYAAIIEKDNDGQI